MNNKRQWQKVVFSAFVIWTMLINSFPVKAQDIVTSEDISGGSSVFVFRTSRKTAQVKAAFRGGSVRGTTAQRTAARQKVRTQAVAVVSKQRPKAAKVDPTTIAYTKGSKNPPVVTTPKGPKVSTPAQTSIALAGAAESYLDKNDLNNAIEFFKIALELNPKNENAKLGLSEAYTRKGDESFDKTTPEAAISFYKQAISFNKQNAAAYAGLAEASEANDADDQAIQNYEAALTYNKDLTTIYEPLGMLYLQKGEIAQADTYLTKALASNSTDKDLQYYVGLVRYKQNRNDEALTLLKQSSAANSDSAEAHYYLGETYDRLDRDQEALAEYNKAVQINPSYVDAWFDLGVANYNRGRYEESAAAYKQVIRLKNDYGQAYANLAETYRQLAMSAKDRPKRQESYELANSNYTLAAVFIKNDPELFNSWAYCLGGVNKWDVAVDRLNTAVSLSPDAAYYSNIGMSYNNGANLDFRYGRDAAAKQKLEKSKVALQKAVSMSPKLFAAQHNLGTALIGLGDYQGAVNAFKSAVDIRNDYFATSLQLGAAYRALKDFDNAVKYLKISSGLNSKFADTWYYLGESEYQRGNKDEARKAYDKLKQLDPNYARRLELVLKGAIPVNPQNRIQNKLQQNNPLNKIPKPF